MATAGQCLGTAFLVVNSYRRPRRPSNLNLAILPRIDEAAKDFWITFNTLGFHTVIYCDQSREQFDRILRSEQTKFRPGGTAKYFVFYFIGHGGDGDVLFMEDGAEVKTEEIVTGFATLPWPDSIRKVFFIDACRGLGLRDPYCPTLPNSFLARSTLPYQRAGTSGTESYGIWSQQLLYELRTSKANLEASLKSVAGKVGEQQAQYTNNGLGDICWKTEASPNPNVPPYPDFIRMLSTILEKQRKEWGVSGSHYLDGDRMEQTIPSAGGSGGLALQSTPLECPRPVMDRVVQGGGESAAQSSSLERPTAGTQQVTLAQVLRENSEEFRKAMISKEIASTLSVMELIPEEVECEIDRSTSREKANIELLKYLKKNDDHDVQKVREIFKIASKKQGYGIMNRFADKMLKQLQSVQPGL